MRGQFWIGKGRIGREEGEEEIDWEGKERRREEEEDRWEGKRRKRGGEEKNRTEEESIV